MSAHRRGLTAAAEAHLLRRKQPGLRLGRELEGAWGQHGAGQHAAWAAHEVARWRRHAARQRSIAGHRLLPGHALLGQFPLPAWGIIAHNKEGSGTVLP